MHQENHRGLFFDIATWGSKIRIVSENVAILIFSSASVCVYEDYPRLWDNRYSRTSAPI